MNFRPSNDEFAKDFSEYHQCLHLFLHRLENSTFAPTVKGPAMLLVNYGLHFQYVGDYKNQYMAIMTRFVSGFAAFHTHGNTVMFVETTAQHFPTFDGHFHMDLDLIFRGLHRHSSSLEDTYYAAHLTSAVSNVANKLFYKNATSLRIEYQEMNASSFPLLDYRCERLNETMAYHQNWQNRVLHDIIAQQLLTKSVAVVPIYELTAARHDITSKNFGDCTHYCKVGMLWLPVFEFIVNRYCEQHHLDISAL